ncbi:carbohydrate-binding protein [Microbulbifer halophilus]|uniref:chitinase n=1 Tax=Microbulbifer halophilus TaxID=453963 RepID=A0ABW5EBN5_9GAMM|nr:glycosyl hydrolase family 18 protein [Microbulbifer halophilus]MCW8126590.1 glycosyl hydrolase family 18 protein [Microbulbifer halophilus]
MKAFNKSKIFGKMTALSALLLSTTLAQAADRVVGYIPSYKNMPAIVDSTDLDKLTHINLSFLNPDASGVVAVGGNPVCMAGPNGGNVSGADIAYVVDQAHQAGVKVLVSVAGGVIPACSGSWQSLLDPANRANTVNNLLDFVATHNLDGLDVDIEGGVLTEIDNAGNYTPFIQELRNGLPAGKLLTSATASYNGGMVPTSSLPYFDFVNIMSYDAVGPSWGTPGIEHSSYEQAVSHIDTWRARGLSADKLVLGVPFYGYGFGSYAPSYSIADIVAQFGSAAAQQDVIGSLCANCNYITYNGIPTIRAKTRLALEEGSGVMIWELSQDASGANSLLGVIDSETGNSGGGSGGDTGNCPQWSQGTSYVAGDVVAYQGGYYIAEHDNPGYDPTISTYFWEPTTADACDDSNPDGFSLHTEAEDYSSMSGVQLEATTDTGGGENVGWIETGDWMAYAGMSLPAAGTYRIEMRVASPSGGSASLDLNAGQTQLGTVNIPATGDWQNWQTVSMEVQLPAGPFDFGIYAAQGGWNINWFTVTRL